VLGAMGNMISTNGGTGTPSAIFLETYKKDFLTNIAGPVPVPGRLVVN